MLQVYDDADEDCTLVGPARTAGRLDQKEQLGHRWDVTGLWLLDADPPGMFPSPDGTVDALDRGRLGRLPSRRLGTSRLAGVCDGHPLR